MIKFKESSKQVAKTKEAQLGWVELILERIIREGYLLEVTLKQRYKGGQAGRTFQTKKKKRQLWQVFCGGIHTESLLSKLEHKTGGAQVES